MDLSFLLIYALNNFRAFFEGKNMSFLKSKTAIKAGELIGRDIMKKVSDFTNELETWTSKNPLNAKTANYPNEDEYMREHNRKKKNASTYSNEANIENIPPMQIGRAHV